MNIKIEVFFEPKSKFGSRIEHLEKKVSFSEITRIWDSHTNIETLISSLLENDICIITTEDCSGVKSHVFENIEFIIGLFEQASIDRILINNPPQFFLTKLKQTSNEVEYNFFKYEKLKEHTIKKVSENFDKFIIGQQKAKKAISRKLIAQMIRPSDKPLVFMFYGAPGIGKTETAKYLSKIIYNNDEIVREQMTMIGGDSSVKYFKATSHNEDSFSKKLLNRSSNVILLDEFALSPSFFHTSFFQMFDEGKYVDQNFSVDVSNSIIICTSNLTSIKEMEEVIDNALLSRFDGFISFKSFSLEEKEMIVEKIYSEMTTSKVMKKKYRDKLDKEQIVNRVSNKLENLPNMRAIRKYVEDCISDFLLDDILK